jgi:ABC-2 type transport system ATP-binding protein
MTPAVSLRGLTRRYRGRPVLDHVDLAVAAGSITGLLGRNGAGKSTLMRILAGQEFASGGDVRVFGQAPPENGAVLRRMVLVREDQSYPDLTVAKVLRAASWFHPAWDGAFAESLLADFGLPADRAVNKLSRGMRSALGITVGLAARAELTMFDEPHTGLDPVARRIFHDRLLADYTDRPRTVLLSTHQIDEAAGLLEHVVLLDRGRVVLDAPADELRTGATRVSGPALAVEEFTVGRDVWDRRRVGSQASVIVVGPLNPADRSPARTSRLTLEPLSLQELVVHTANRATAALGEAGA